jgi:hypothetical protein
MFAIALNKACNVSEIWLRRTSPSSRECMGNIIARYLFTERYVEERAEKRFGLNRATVSLEWMHRTCRSTSAALRCKKKKKTPRVDESPRAFDPWRATLSDRPPKRSLPRIAASRGILSSPPNIQSIAREKNSLLSTPPFLPPRARARTAAPARRPP